MVQSLVLPKVAILPVTMACNARCKMCNIWHTENEKELSIDDYNKIFSQPILCENISSVNITGGEPFLRKDLLEITNTLLSCCKVLDSVVVNSNGFLTEEICKYFLQLKDQLDSFRRIKLFLFLSLDGIGQLHDEIRGVSGAFGLVERTLLKLRDYSHVDVILNTTVTKYNYTQLEDILCFAEEMNCKIDFTYAMSSEIYFNNVQTLETADGFVRGEFISFLKQNLKNGTLYNSPSYYRNLIHMLSGKKRKVGCVFSNQGFFLKPDGSVYRCWPIEEVIGNIHTMSFMDIWNNMQPFDQQRCDNCYNNCYYLYKRSNAIQRLSGSMI